MTTRAPPLDDVCHDALEVARDGRRVVTATPEVTRGLRSPQRRRQGARRRAIEPADGLVVHAVQQERVLELERHPLGLVAQAEVVRDAAGHDERLLDRHRPRAPLEQLLVRHLDAEHLAYGRLGRAHASLFCHSNIVPSRS